MDVRQGRRLSPGPESHLAVDRSAPPSGGRRHRTRVIARSGICDRPDVIAGDLHLFEGCVAHSSRWCSDRAEYSIIQWDCKSL